MNWSLHERPPNPSCSLGLPTATDSLLSVMMMNPEPKPRKLRRHLTPICFHYIPRHSSILCRGGAPSKDIGWFVYIRIGVRIPIFNMINDLSLSVRGLLPPQYGHGTSTEVNELVLYSLKFVFHGYTCVRLLWCTCNLSVEKTVAVTAVLPLTRYAATVNITRNLPGA